MEFTGDGSNLTTGVFTLQSRSPGSSLPADAVMIQLRTGVTVAGCCKRNSNNVSPGTLTC